MLVAHWLNKAFYNFDDSIFKATYDLELNFPWVAKLARFISYFGDHGYFFIALVVVLCIFRKTRKIGVTLAIGMIIGVLVNNVFLKNLIARPRPYDTVSLFKDYWLAHSNVLMNSYSFPSGHTTMASVIGVGLFLTVNKKFRWAFLLIPLLMGWSRIALFVHYPSDVLFGLIVGAGSMVGAYFLSKLLFKWKLAQDLTSGNSLF